ncbi:MAG: hypothetical protein ACREBO_08985 [Novosphingobium sp.]
MSKLLALPLALLASPALAQEHDHSKMDHGPAVPAPAPVDHSAMDHDDMAMEEILACSCSIAASAEGSGTSRLPASEGAMHGLHLSEGDWMIMAHGYVSTQYTDHSGPRGDDKVYVTSMGMLAAQRDTGWGRVQLKSMFSLEPAMDSSGYPNLFASGETSRGSPLIDLQHPHDLFMELSARIDVNLSDSVWGFVYGGPVGEPALGPSAFMHRGSARYNPEPPITHHWFDSTHIVYGVVTAGLAGRTWQFEGSAFRGQEPDEDRWDIETPRLDSWSARATWNPSPAWSVQASYGELKQPEALHPGEDEHRFTASAHYARGGFSAMAAFSAKDRVPGNTLTAWIAEANWDLDAQNTLFGRFENVANDELFPDHQHPLHDRTFRVSKFQAGYARRMPLGPFELALGGSLSAYAKPAALDPYYGRNPMGYTLFAKLTLGH